MKTGTKIVTLLLILNLFSYNGSAQEVQAKKPTTETNFSKTEKSTFPKSIGIINDFSKIYTESQRSELFEILNDYTIKTTRQITIVTIDNIKPYHNIQKYAKDLGNYWGVGNAEKNNGITIVICNPCRQIGIATGVETELILTDAICKEVIDKTITPEFRKGNFYNGIKNGVIDLIEKWN